MWWSQRSRIWHRGALYAWLVRLHAPAPVHRHPPLPTHTKYEILNAFAQHQWFRNAPQCYVIRTLYVLLYVPVSEFSLGGPDYRVIWTNSPNQAPPPHYCPDDRGTAVISRKMYKFAQFELFQIAHSKRTPGGHPTTRSPRQHKHKTSVNGQPVNNTGRQRQLHQQIAQAQATSQHK